MDTTTPKFKIRLGLFVVAGFAIFAVAIFIIGKQTHMFDPVFRISTNFYNVSGLQVGNNIRFSGIAIGTVDNMKIVNDSMVRVDMVIKKSVQQFIKADSEAGIGSEGIIGDRLVVISQGSIDAPAVKDGSHIASIEPIETDAIMESLSISAANAEIITHQLAEVMVQINSGEGTLGRLIQDATIADNLGKTMANLKESSKGMDQSIDAAKESFLLRGVFKKREKAAAKKLEDEKKAAEKAAKKLEDEKKAAEKAAKKNE